MCQHCVVLGDPSFDMLKTLKEGGNSPLLVDMDWLAVVLSVMMAEMDRNDGGVFKACDACMVSCVNGCN
jgi:hypothetical protein